MVNCRISELGGETSYLPLPPLSDGEDIRRWVYGITKNIESEGRNGPAFNRLSARSWRDVKESEAIAFHRGKVSMPEVPDVIPVRGLTGQQFLGTFRHSHPLGPLVRKLFA